MEGLQQYRKLIIILGVVIFTGFFTLLSITIFYRSGKVSVSLNALPSDSIITLNNVPVKPGTTYVTPGTYKIVAKKNGFADFQRTIAVGEGNPATINATLIPVSEDAKKWALEHKDEYADFSILDKSLAKTKDNRAANDNPITEKLPYKNLLYNITYRPDETDQSGNRIVIEIDASRAYRSAALFQIRKWGYDPTDYRIEFRGYTNPITS